MVIVAALLFAALPNVETFATFSLIIGLALVPLGAVFALQWQPAIFTGMITVFVPLLAPTNPMSYDPQQYYNAALAIVPGVGAAVLSFRLAVAGIPDPSAAGADVARSPSPRDGPDPTDARRLGGPHVWPIRGIAGSGATVAALATDGGVLGR